MVVSGTGASFSAAGVTAVGSAGDGFLEATVGAVIESGSAVVAQAQASFGLVLISGTDSSWTVAGTMTIGGGGHATMTIADDADVTSGSTIIAQQLGGDSDVTVSGVGTSWSIDGSLDVGMVGAGNLTICDGGAVFAQDTFVTIGTFPVSDVEGGGVGVVTVCGPGSYWFVDGDLYVGFLASGTLNVLDGATVISQNAVVGLKSYKTGSAAHVDGFGSLWSNAGPMLVNTKLSVTGGGRVVADSVMVEELEGDGIVQTVAGSTTASVTRVGNPVGTLSIDGGFTATELLLDLSAAAPGGYDRLAVAGPVQVVGSVNVTLVGGFVPQAGDSFVVVTSSGIQGIPDVALPVLPEPLIWLVNQAGGSLELLVSKLGDANGDGIVNVADLLELLGLWGPCAPPCPADFNGDGQVERGGPADPAVQLRRLSRGMSGSRGTRSLDAGHRELDVVLVGREGHGAAVFDGEGHDNAELRQLEAMVAGGLEDVGLAAVKGREPDRPALLGDLVTNLAVGKGPAADVSSTARPPRR